MSITTGLLTNAYMIFFSVYFYFYFYLLVDDRNKILESFVSQMPSHYRASLAAPIPDSTETLGVFVVTPVE